MKSFEKISMVKMLDEELKKVVGGVNDPVLRYAIYPLYGIVPDQPGRGPGAGPGGPSDPIVIPLYGILAPVEDTTV